MRKFKGFLIAGVSLAVGLLSHVALAGYITDFSINPASKNCEIPQDGISTTCDINFVWSTFSDPDPVVGTAGSNRSLKVGGVAVASGAFGNYTASISLGSTSYALDFSESPLNGNVTATYGDFTSLFSHSTSTHNTVTGDFDGNGTQDNYYQPKTKGTVGGLMPVVSNDFLDASFHRSWTTTHPQIAAIEDWSEESYGAFKGNFNANPGDELLLLGNKTIILLHGDIITPITTFPTVNNAIVSWDANNAASHTAFDFDANPADFVVHVGDLSGDGFDEIFLQRKSSGSTSYILSNTGSLVQTLTSGFLNMDWSAASYAAQISGGDIHFTALGANDDDNVTVTNSSGAVTSLATAITKPTISVTSLKYLFQDVPYNLTPSFTSSAGSVTFSVSGQPAWMTLNSLTGVLSGTPGVLDTNQSHTITLTVRENKTHTISASTTFTIEVVESFQINQKDYSVYQAADGTLYLVSSDGLDAYKIVEDNGNTIILKSSISEFNASGATLLAGYQVVLSDQNGDGNIDLLLKPAAGSNLESIIIDNVDDVHHNVILGDYVDPAPMPHIEPIPARDLISDAIGSTAGEFRVDEGGQANYSIPLYIPTGVAGVKPSVSLSYNSSGGNGHLGLGWSITGSSSISRCSKSKLIDGEFGSVNLDYDDRFCLDGSRLVLVSGEYGQPGSEYRTFIASQTKIIARGIAGQGPSYFEVWRKDGSYNTYGFSADSQYLANDVGIVSDTAFAWAQTYSEDRFNNRINYFYTEDEVNGEFHIDRIEYAPNVKIQFNHVAGRSDFKDGFYLGGKTRLSQLLDSIQVFDNDIEVRKYDLTYQTGQSGYSRLNSITESKDGVSLQPTIFSWADPVKGIQTDFVEHNGIKFITGTFINVDQDLMPEWIHVDDNDTLWVNDLTGDPTVSSDPNAVIASNLNVHQFNGEQYLNTCLSRFKGDAYDGRNFEVFDINGDGIDEAIITTTDKVVAVFFDGSGCLASWVNRTLELADIDTNEKKWFFGDINGDALPDIVYHRNDKTYIKYHLGDAQTPTAYYTAESLVTFDFTSVVANSSWDIEQKIIVKADHAAFSDFNSDGRIDMVVKVIKTQSRTLDFCEGNFGHPECSGTQGIPTTLSTDWMVVTANGNHQFKEFVNFGNLGTKVTRSEHIKLVDVNQDGLVDLVYPSQLDNEWNYRLFTGKKFLNPQTTHVSSNAAIYFGDHDFDGLNEVLYFQGNEIYSREFQQDGTLPVTGTNTQIRGESGWMFAQIDINADGELDIISVEPDEHLTHTSYDNYASFNKTPFQVSDKINFVENGLGNKTYITYKALTDPSEPDLYESHQGWQFDSSGQITFNIRGPQYVVSKAESSAPYYQNVGNLNGIEYRYGKQRAHSIYGNMGFEWLETIDLQTDMITRSTYSQDYPHIGSPIQTQVWYQNRVDSRLLSEAFSEYASKSVGSYIKPDGTSADIIFPYLSKAKEDSYDFNTTTLTTGQRISRTLTTNIYNNYGDPTEQNTYVCTDSSADFCELSGGIKRTQTNNSYKTADTTNWILGRLSQTQVNHYRSGQPTVTRTSAFEYDGTSGILTAEIIEPLGTPNEHLRTEYSHDSFGNITRKTLCNVDLDCGNLPTDDPTDVNYVFDSNWVHRTSSTEYDLDGRYVVKTFNGYGQTISHVFERNELGQPTIVADLNGNLTDTKYGTFGEDFFSRLITGGWSKQTKRLCSDAGIECPVSALVRVESFAAGGGRSYQYIDALGREIKTSVLGFDGTDVVTETQYDAQGRLYAQSVPYFADGVAIPQFTITSYDILNRVNQVDYPDLSQDRTYYDGYDNAEQAVVTRVVNALLQEKKEYRNILGELVKVMDNASNVLSYQYNATGDLLEVQMNNLTQSVIEYDRMGRKVKMWDWDKGAQNSKFWSYVYNAAGELISQTDAKDQTTEIYFDRAGRKVRQLDKDSAGVSVADARWNYNTSTTVDGFTAQLLKQYDKLNSALVVEPDYDVFGRNDLTTTTIDGLSFVQSTTFDEFGRVFQSFDASGNNHGLQNIYNERGYLSQVRESKGGIYGVVYKTIKSMDAFGNVTREDAGNGIITTRHYDPKTGRVERIISAYDVQPPIQEIEYQWDVLGRLQYRNSLAKGLRDDFTYDNLNRVDTVNTENRFDYDAKGNITWKKGVGNYTYGETCNGVIAGHHAVTSITGNNYCYDLNGNLVSDSERSLTYSTFDKPTQIVKGTHKTEFVYAPTRSRYKRVDTASGEVTKTYYLGNTEYIVKPTGQTIFRRNVSGVVVKVSSEYDKEVNYIHVDHLGSTDIITDGTGIAVQEVSFDAFGEKRLPNNWQVKDTAIKLSPSDITSKGYTGHEMAEEVGIIHMNGRIYDPRLGRFLQADPFIDGVTDSQGYNRYSYVRNNPLAYIDPTGFKRSGGLKNFRRLMDPGNIIGTLSRRFSWFASVYQTAATAIASYFCPPCGAGVAAFTSSQVSAASGGNLTQSLQAGARSYASSYISGKFGGGDNLFQSAVVGGVASVVAGGKFGQGFASSFLNGLYDGNDVAMGAIIGGTISKATGGKFVNGAISGAFAAARMGNSAQVTEAELQAASDRVGEFLESDAVQKNRIAINDISGDWRNTPRGMSVFEFQMLRADASGEAAIHGALFLTGEAVFAYGARAIAALRVTKTAGNVKGLVTSRINLSNKGMDHVISRHLNPAKAGNKSQFNLSEDGLRSLLSAKSTIHAPVTALETGNFARTITTNKIIGNLADKMGGASTKTFTVISDKAGNIQTAFPGVL